jgi:hypothetical protein
LLPDSLHRWDQLDQLDLPPLLQPLPQTPPTQESDLGWLWQPPFEGLDPPKVEAHQEETQEEEEEEDYQDRLAKDQ